MYDMSSVPFCTVVIICYTTMPLAKPRYTGNDYKLYELFISHCHKYVRCTWLHGLELCQMCQKNRSLFIYLPVGMDEKRVYHYYGDWLRFFACKNTISKQFDDSFPQEAEVVATFEAQRFGPVQRNSDRLRHRLISDCAMSDYRKFYFNYFFCFNIIALLQTPIMS